MSELEFHVATEQAELEQVHRLNYATFVEEIPQHEPNAERRLVDRMLEQSTVYVGVQDGEVVGMAAVSGTRPFSIDRKVPNVDELIPPCDNPCEVRLLAVRPDRRGGRALGGLARCLYEHGRVHGHDLMVISAAMTQERLYRHMGFVPFGPPIGTEAAPYQGMYLTWENISGVVHAVSRPAEINLLPGPVAIAPEVHEAFHRAPVSHRGEPFLDEFASVKAALCRLTQAPRCELLLGSGTLANDAVAAQLGLEPSRGVVVVNGEFGERLVDQAARAGLQFERVDAPWGAPPDWAAVERAAAGAGWLWAVHCETSTGVLNDLDRLKAIASASGARLCLDAISSLGAAPLDLTGVHLATGTSGKALGGYPGVAVVFHQAPLRSAPSLPRYLDLGLYDVAQGVPFTHSSNLLAALAVAVARLEEETVQARVAVRRRWTTWLRAELAAIGCAVMGDAAHAAPAVVTFEPPAHTSAAALGEQLEARGFFLSHRSRYLQRRNLIQICLMGELDQAQPTALMQKVRELTAPAAPASDVARSSQLQAR